MAKSQKPANKISILDGKFQLVDREPKGKVALQFGTFDMANLTESQAELLVAKRVTWIEKVAE